MNERNVAEMFRDITDRPEPPLGISAERGLAAGRRLRRRRQLLQTWVTMAAVGAVVAGGITVATVIDSPSRQQAAGPGRVPATAKPAPGGIPGMAGPTGPAKQVALPPMRWDCREESGPGGQFPPPALTACLAPARAETASVLRELGAKYDAVSVTPMTEAIRFDGGYPEFQGFFTSKTAGNVDVSWFYETHGARAWSQCPRADSNRRPGTEPIKKPNRCEDGVDSDGSRIVIQYPKDPSNDPSGQPHVSRFRPDGLTIIVTGGLPIAELIELSRSPLFRG